MLVSIAGSQGAGKSTILSSLIHDGYNVITRKTSRSILQEWGVTLDMVNSDYDLTIKFQNEILIRKINDEYEAAQSDQLWFTERTFADLFTYAVITLGKDNMYSDYLEQYYIDCMRAQQQYAHIFYLKAGMFKIENDGVRGASLHYSRMVDLVMSDITQQMSLPGYISIIDTPCLNQRTNIIRVQTERMKKNTSLT